MARIRREAAMQTTAEIMWCVAIYIRLSREDGGVESGSVTNQKKILIEYIEKQFAGRFTLVDFYIDDGLTGTDNSRESFMRMIQDIESDKINCVLVKTLSRAFRNYSDQGYYLEYYFPQKNVRFISTGDPHIDTFTNPEAITSLEVPITGLMNDRYAAKISADVRRTFDYKRRNGEFIGAFAPYGYIKDPKNKNRLLLDEEIVPIKRNILHWFIRDGMSLNGIAHRLNALGIPNPSAYKRRKGIRYHSPATGENDGLWAGQTVRRVLSDKVNLGHMVQGKQRVVSYKVHDLVRVPEAEWFVVENTHEATFSQVEYDTLTRMLQRDTRTANNSRTMHLFSGFLKCIDCGKALQRKRGKDKVYYACRTYTEKSKTKCTKHSIRLDLLEEAALATIQSQIALVDLRVLHEANYASVVSATARIDKTIGEKQRKLARAKSLADGLYEDWKTGELDQEEYQRMKAKYRQQTADVSEIIAKLEEEKERLAAGGSPGSDAIEAFLKCKNISALDRALLAELLDTIYVHEDKQITIVFRFVDELARNASFFTPSCG